MKQNSLALVSWITLVGALFAWVGVVSLALFIIRIEHDRSALADTADQTTNKQALAARVHALARQSAEKRMVLEKTANVDVVAAVNIIESVGALAGVTLRVRDARNEKSASPRAGGLELFTIGLYVEAEGSFSGIMRALQIFETVPLPISLDQFDIGRAPLDEQGSNPNLPWRLNARLRLLSTAKIST